MKHRVRTLLLLMQVSITVCSPLMLRAEETQRLQERQTTETTLQLRTDFTYTCPLHPKVSMVLFEDLRLDLLPFAPQTVFDLSLTSVSVVYAPIPQLKLTGGYMLKIHGASSANTFREFYSKPVNYIRHRAYASVTGIWKPGHWTLSLREQALCDMRFDEINLYTANRYHFTLRHYLCVQYNFPKPHLTPYVWTEAGNTLNAKAAVHPAHKQYLTCWRTAAGLKWKIAPEKHCGTLNFFYRYDWGCTRSAVITKDHHIYTRHLKHEHAIGIGYEL
ncbi:MAG: DUF2490 domain-containing protein [Paludibacteraceae bacterium]|nr:DUF2490 domain-containing protein [Paludibacteraceae bacterium]